MEIKPEHTVGDIMMKKVALFSLGNDRIYNAIKDLPIPEHIGLRTGLIAPNKSIPVRSVHELTMQELDAIQNRKTGYDYFCTCLAVMLKIEEEDVQKLQFIRSYRYFLNIQKELKMVAKEWKKLEMPLRKEEKQAKVKRPNRGLVSMCRQYVQLMNGSVTTEQAWETPWRIVYEAFEGAFYDNLEQRRLSDIMMSKNKYRK